MAKFAIECPKCGSINTASTFLFAKKTIQCATCNEEINIKESRLTSKECPHCGKVFVYDQAKSRNRQCPSCGKRIDAVQAATMTYKLVHINCPQCACDIEVDKTKEIYACPVCDAKIDVKKEIAKQDLVKSAQISVLKYEGDNSTFVWKHPIEDFNSGSQLIVHESQEAIFFLNGEALDTFGPGRHTLETQNLPLLQNVYKMPTGNQTPFHAEVYFINKTVQMGMKWGTDSRVRFIDPPTGIPLDIGASGEMNLQVSDGRKLLLKLVGTTSGLSNKQVLSSDSDHSDVIHKTLKSYFRAPLMTEIKSYLATVIKEKQINILEFDQHIGVLSEALQSRISPKFEEFGLRIPQFFITTISLPEQDPNFKKIKELISKAYIGVKEEEVQKKIVEAAGEREMTEVELEARKAELKARSAAEIAKLEAQAEAEKIRSAGLAEAEVMRAKGYSHKDELEAEVQKEYAKGMGNMGGGGGSSSGGGVASDVVGAMIGMKMADKMMEQFNLATQSAPAATPAAAPQSNVSNANTWTCSCGATVTGKFCSECGAAKVEPWTCSCGHTGNTGKFCSECGSPKKTTWDCACGKKDNAGKFCSECGARKPE